MTHNARVLIVLGAVLTLCTGQTIKTSGPVSLSCSKAGCSIPTSCDDRLANSVPEGAVQTVDDVNGLVKYTNIEGQFFLEASATDDCEVECSGCFGVPGIGGDVSGDEGSCLGAAGYIYCTETQECIRPWEKNCPLGDDLQDTSTWQGPGTLICEEGGRCNVLSEDCAIVVGTYDIGGKYLTGLIGNYVLTTGCLVTCQSCACDGCTPSSAGGANVRAWTFMVATFIAMTLIL